MNDVEREAEVQRRLRLPYHRVVYGDPDDGYMGEVPELPGCYTARRYPRGGAEQPRRSDGCVDPILPHQPRPNPRPGTESPTGSLTSRKGALTAAACAEPARSYPVAKPGASRRRGPLAETPSERRRPVSFVAWADSARESTIAGMERLHVRAWAVALALILVLGAGLRLHGLRWDQPEGADHPLQMHPDERFLSLVGDHLDWPSSLGPVLRYRPQPAQPVQRPGHAFVRLRHVPALSRQGREHRHRQACPTRIGPIPMPNGNGDDAGIGNSYDTTVIWGRRLAAHVRYRHDRPRLLAWARSCSRERPGSPARCSTHSPSCHAARRTSGRWTRSSRSSPRRRCCSRATSCAPRPQGDGC